MNGEKMVHELSQIVGPKYVTVEEFILRTYTNDFGVSLPRRPVAVVRPGSTDEIGEIMKFAHKNKVPVSPRGGGSAQEGGCQAVEGGIVLETLRLNQILHIDEENATVTVQAGVTFGKLMNSLEEKGWKIGVAPSGALAGTVGAHLSRPGVGWGNIKYVSQGDQILGVKAVLPTGDVVNTGTGANPQADTFFRYALGPDLTGLFLGAEGAYGIVTEATLRLYPYPEEIYLERFIVRDRGVAIKIFQEIAIHNLTCYISAPLVNPDYVLFDINIEGYHDEVALRKERVRDLILKYPGVELRGAEEPNKFWSYRWYNTGMEFKEGIAGVVNFFLPFDQLDGGLRVMREIIDRHQIKNYVQQVFPGPSASEVVALLFHFPGDEEEYHKIRAALDEMMDKALEMGGAPYSKGRQWAPYLKKYLADTGYGKLAQAIKTAVDPNHIMNPGVAGL
ncbi:FAD-binding oxidoreductase [Candidatus Formimonas warabiya]|uniref:D-lactate dehydrogenase (cytochrome) n=1 Tax=Formimonas warabiya TaxID=1761012 RepID=A0A3G1KUL9_FORW1|nr:FAD-binding oxidoreductase [Candidatus Formimonas warabiya]ATW25885.1 hypothetical protein DCMF_14885 [Candidatus Formimonas warabiya]